MQSTHRRCRISSHRNGRFRFFKGSLTVIKLFSSPGQCKSRNTQLNYGQKTIGAAKNYYPRGTNRLNQFGAGSYSKGFLQAVLILQGVTNKIEGSQA